MYFIYRWIYTRRKVIILLFCKCAQDILKIIMLITIFHEYKMLTRSLVYICHNGINIFIRVFFLSTQFSLDEHEIHLKEKRAGYFTNVVKMV